MASPSSSPAAAAAVAAVVVKEIWVYPLKSGRGLSLPSATVGPTGFAFDRQWMLVNNASGRFVTQRTHPKLATIVPSVPHEFLHLTPDVWPDAPAEAAVDFSSEWKDAGALEPLRVPLNFHGKQAWKRVKIWEWEGAAVDEGDEAAEWFSKALDEPDIRLVRHVGSLPKERLASDELGFKLEKAFGKGFFTAFPDGFPYLLASESSLRELNRRLADKGESTLPMTRFRPNIVVMEKKREGGGESETAEEQGQLVPFVEDTWDVISFASATVATDADQAPVRFRCVKPCSRCKVTTTDQLSGAVTGREPLRELGNFRTPRAIYESDVFQKKRLHVAQSAGSSDSAAANDTNLQMKFIEDCAQAEKQSREVYFGVNCLSLPPLSGSGTLEIRVGDSVAIE